MFDIVSSDIVRLERDLGILSKRAQPYARSSALDGMAFAAQGKARETIKNEFTNRNQYTVKSVQVDRAKLSGGSYSVVGTVAPYMATQELGGSRSKKGKHGVAIPTKAAAEAPNGQGVGPRQRMVRRNARLTNLNVLASVRVVRNRKQLNAALVGAAVRSGRDKVVFLDLGRRKGLFRVTGPRKRPQIRMLYDLSDTVVKVKRHPVIYPAAQYAADQGPSLYVKALEDQIRRQHLFRSSR